MTRCYNKKGRSYRDYGARGITVCRAWRTSFPAFLKALGKRPTPKHSLGRKNNDLGYTPNNTRWETKKQQDRNRRSNLWITVRGKRATLVEWSERTGIGRTTLKQRINLGWSPEDVVDKPLRGAKT